MANLSAPSLKKFLEHVANIFNITKYDGKWLRMEDKKLYKKQLEFNGRIGYTTGGAHPENFKWGGGLKKNSIPHSKADSEKLSIVIEQLLQHS